jgi:thiamine pyrophosphokinase
MINSENKVLILTGGQIEETLLKNRLAEEQYSMIIAADHGLNIADQINLSLDYIVGDFDSVSETILEKYRKISTPIQTFPKEKDKTDTQIAIELALMNNATAIDLIGATGTRLDHTIANIHLLMLPMQLNINVCILDSHNKIYLKRKSFTIIKDRQYGNYVSLLPFNEQVTGLTLKGFKYPLNSITLSPGSSLGISNEILEEEAAVEFTNGILLVVESRD